MKMKTGFILAILSLALVGCGGGGGATPSISGNSTPAPTVISLKTSSIRIFQPGDVWSYTGIGTYQNASGIVPVTGTVQTQALGWVLDPNNVSTLDEHTVINLNSSSGSVVLSSHQYGLQDQSGSLFLYGVGSTINYWAQQGIPVLQSPMAVGQNYGTGWNYYLGGSVVGTENRTINVIGVEDISTGIGNLQAYKINLTDTYANLIETVVENNVVWYVPGVGTVATSMDVNYFTPSNAWVANLKFNAVLSSTSITY